MDRTDTDPAEFIASLPQGVRDHIATLDAAISTAMGDPPKTMWEGTFWGGSEQQIIGYGDLTQPRPGGETVDWFMVGLAPQKNYLSVYVNAADDDGYLVAKSAGRLGKVKIGSASIGFKSIDDIDVDALSELVAAAGEQLSPSAD